MNAQHTHDLHALTWPVSRLDEAVTTLVQKTGFEEVPAQLPRFPQYLEKIDEVVIGQWFEIAANRLGLEIESVESPYDEVKQMVCRAAPALILLPDKNIPRFLVVLKGKRRLISVIAPDLTIQHIRPEDVRDSLTYPLEEPLIETVQKLVRDAGVHENRRAHAQKAILHEQLSTSKVGGCWILKLSPASHIWKQIRYAQLPHYLLIILGLMIVDQIFMVAGWWLIGRAALEGHFEYAWLLAWALLVFTSLPFDILGEWVQNIFSLKIESIFKQRLLFGILQLEPEEIRQYGT
jgi:ATP-binding cassette subfamily B protein